MYARIIITIGVAFAATIGAFLAFFATANNLFGLNGNNAVEVMCAAPILPYLAFCLLITGNWRKENTRIASYSGLSFWFIPVFLKVLLAGAQPRPPSEFYIILCLPVFGLRSFLKLLAEDWVVLVAWTFTIVPFPALLVAGEINNTLGNELAW